MTFFLFFPKPVPHTCGQGLPKHFSDKKCHVFNVKASLNNPKNALKSTSSVINDLVDRVNTSAGPDYDGGVLGHSKELKDIAFYARKPEDRNSVDPNSINIERTVMNENGKLLR